MFLCDVSVIAINLCVIPGMLLAAELAISRYKLRSVIVEKR